MTAQTPTPEQAHEDAAAALKGEATRSLPRRQTLASLKVPMKSRTVAALLKRAAKLDDAALDTATHEADGAWKVFVDNETMRRVSGVADETPIGLGQLQDAVRMETPDAGPGAPETPPAEQKPAKTAKDTGKGADTAAKPKGEAKPAKAADPVVDLGFAPKAHATFATGRVVVFLMDADDPRKLTLIGAYDSPPGDNGKKALERAVAAGDLAIEDAPRCLCTTTRNAWTVTKQPDPTKAK